MGIKHVALTWTTDDVRNAIEQHTEKEQEQFVNVAGASERDLQTWLDCMLDDFQDDICEFINQLIADAVEKTIEEDENI